MSEFVEIADEPAIPDDLDPGEGIWAAIDRSIAAAKAPVPTPTPTPTPKADVEPVPFSGRIGGNIIPFGRTFNPIAPRPGRPAGRI